MSLQISSVACLFVVLISSVSCHKRLFWPTPRSTRTAATSSYPCGGVSFEDAFADGLTTDLEAGSTIDIIVHEQIFHSGEPMRISLSGPNNDNFDCVLLNHIPQHIVNNGEQKNLSISLTVPDISCQNCTLQLLALQAGGRADSQCCSYTDNETNSCGESQYFSCANININNGRRSIGDVCEQPSGWAFRDLPCNLYGDEKSQEAWEDVNGDGTWLRLKTSGTVGTTPSSDVFCGESAQPFGINSQCHRFATDFTTLSLLEGGEFSTDGVVAVILVVALVIVIGATFAIARKREKASVGDNNSGATQPGPR